MLNVLCSMFHDITMKNILLIIVAIAIVIAALFYLLNQNKPEEFNVDQYLTLNEQELNEAQLSYYNEIKEKLAKNKQDLDAILELSNLYSFIENYEKAEEILNYLKSLENTDKTIILQNMGSVYHNQGRYKEAEQAYLEIIKVNILWIQAYEALSQLYRFELVPNNPDFPVLVEEGMAKDYAKQFEQSFLKILGFYYQYQGNNEKSLEYFKEYMEKYPDDENIKKVYEDMGGSL